MINIHRFLSEQLAWARPDADTHTATEDGNGESRRPRRAR